MLRKMVFRMVLGAALVAGLGIATNAPALAGGIAGPIVLGEGKQPVPGGSAPVTPRVKDITRILNNMGGGAGKNTGGRSFNDNPDGSQAPHTRSMDGQFAKSRTGSGGNGFLQFASTDPDQVIQLSQSALAEDALLGQGALGPVNLWVDGSVSFVDSRLTGNVYDGRLGTVMPGIDAEPIPGLLIGFGLPYQFGSLDFQQDVSELDYTGIGIVPYVDWAAMDDLLISLKGGMSWFNNKTTVNGNGANGEFDSETWFADLSAAYIYRLDTVNLIGRIGYLQVHDSTTGFTLTNGTPVGDEQSDIGQGRLELKVEYPFGRYTPFVEGKIEHEFMSPGNPIRNNVVATDDTTGGEIGFGLIADIAPELSALVRFDSVIFREDYNEHTLMAGVRLSF